MWAVGMGVPIALPFLPNPTVALYLFGSCFGDWVGLDWSQGCVQSFTLTPLHTPPYTLSLLSDPSAWGQNSLLLQKSLWLSPYHPIHTDRDSNIPPYIK